LAAACGCGSRYRKLGGFPPRGYVESELGYGRYLVSYRGRDLEFCKAAGFYRAAHLCEELGFAYFKVTSEQVYKTFVQRKRPVNMDDPTFRSVTEIQDTAGLERKDEMAGYNYSVEFLKNDPLDGRAYDAADILRSRPVPGTDRIRNKLEQHDGK
jgi:hypothetical protein